MEQEPIYAVEKFDKSKVDLSKPARNVEEYMRQVIVSREQMQDVTVAKESVREIKKRTVFIPQDEEEPVCSFVPSAEWREVKLANFKRIREVFEIKRQRCASKLDVKFPGQNNESGWIDFCLTTRNANVHISPENAEKFAHHKGTPPTLQLMLTMPDRYVKPLIIHLVKHYIENGYSKPLSEWIFALLIAVPATLPSDVVSQLRDFTRYLKSKRAELTEDQLDRIREYTLFITIITMYFRQKDLADK
ncbi:unnamed protein product [Bursaphelenchus okinawaensis]|uniref:Gem-associated protein 2 n=1 Tax=Bursaphelenchus okinawaensis TaxID=465554 RepID=A0A811JUM4_9BILA|nr:unnamed protein product [Bursaphelenchus okinawaensis]CAG9084564.1 unnamed protein product [Bursaphelenchus okinawaensis]